MALRSLCAQHALFPMRTDDESTGAGQRGRRKGESAQSTCTAVERCNTEVQPYELAFDLVSSIARPACVSFRLCRGA